MEDLMNSTAGEQFVTESGKIAVYLHKFPGGLDHSMFVLTDDSHGYLCIFDNDGKCEMGDNIKGKVCNEKAITKAAWQCATRWYDSVAQECNYDFKREIAEAYREGVMRKKYMREND